MFVATGLVIPVIEVDGPRVLLAETKDGAPNFRFDRWRQQRSLKIGAVRIPTVMRTW
jgi:hypothetical protein